MSHDKLFLIVPPRPRPSRSGNGDLGNLLLWAIVIHGVLLLVSWGVFLAASIDVRVLIIVLWVGYIALVSAFIAALARSSR